VHATVNLDISHFTLYGRQGDERLMLASPHKMLEGKLD